MNSNGNGVTLVVAHLLITFAILGIYAYSLITGHPDQTVANLLYSILGYWFGALALPKIITGSSSNNASTSEPPSNNNLNGRNQ